MPGEFRILRILCDLCFFASLREKKMLAINELRTTETVVPIHEDLLTKIYRYRPLVG